MFLKGVVISRNVSGNIPPLEEPQEDQQREQWEYQELELPADNIDSVLEGQKMTM
jgi:hypothetical protein